MSLTTLKDSSWEGSSIAALWLPTPIPTPSSSAAAARAAFTGIVSGCPPVIEAIKKGACRRFPRKSTDRSSLSISSSGSALWIRVTSSKPALTFRDSTELVAHIFRCSIFRLEVVLIILHTLSSGLILVPMDSPFKNLCMLSAFPALNIYEVIQDVLLSSRSSCTFPSMPPVTSVLPEPPI